MQLQITRFGPQRPELADGVSDRVASMPPQEEEGVPGGEEESAPLMGSEHHEQHEKHIPTFTLKRLFKFIGPGLLMCIAYVDPGNLESDLQTGTNTGYRLLWLLLWTTVLGFVVQMQAVKLGVATGHHLAQHCRREFPVVPRYCLWIMAEVAIIGSDIQEVIGSAIALGLLSRGVLPLWAGVVLSAVGSFVLLGIERLGVRFLEGFFGILISVMVCAFAGMYVRADVPVAKVAEGFFLPYLPRKDISTAVALVGSLIMPHNIYLHSALVQTRKLHVADDRQKAEALVYFGVESALAMGVTVFINMFVVCVFAAGFYGKPGIGEIGLENAGKFLGATYGGAVVFIWALGLLAAGQSATMTGCYTGQFVMGGYLQMNISPWLRVTITRLVAIVPTLAVALMSGNSWHLDALNQWLNQLQSVQLPFALIPVLAFCGNPRIVGPAFANSRGLSVLTWMISLSVILINMAAAYDFAETLLRGRGAGLWALFAGAVLLYGTFIVYLLVYATGCSSLLSEHWLRWAAPPKQPPGEFVEQQDDVQVLLVDEDEEREQELAREQAEAAEEAGELAPHGSLAIGGLRAAAAAADLELLETTAG